MLGFLKENGIQITEKLLSPEYVEPKKKKKSPVRSDVIPYVGDLEWDSTPIEITSDDVRGYVENVMLDEFGSTRSPRQWLEDQVGSSESDRFEEELKKDIYGDMLEDYKVETEGIIDKEKIHMPPNNNKNKFNSLNELLISITFSNSVFPSILYL
jgi:hypothetical protein